MSLETVTLEHVPPSFQIHLVLFRNVRNAAFLHQQLLGRNSDFEYAFVDAAVIISRRQLLAAVFKAITNASQGALKTPNVHSETVVSLSSSSNIAEAYRRFGISPKTTNLAIVKITFPTETKPNPSSAEEIWKHLQEAVEGQDVPATEMNIASCTDLQVVRKNYKLNGLAWLEAIKDEALKRSELEALVISGMALRGL